MNTDYATALMNCNQNPAYFAKLPTGALEPCVCYPLMPADVYGWQIVKRKIRSKKIRTNTQLEEDADLKNWEDVEHYGKATYVRNDAAAMFEHNGALFDIGSRF